MRTSAKPVYLNLFRLHLPITGWVSILHRLSGALLFLVLPPMVWTFTRTLSDAEAFARVAAWLASPWAKWLALALVGATTLHFVAGLRHLVMDAHLCMSLKCARLSSAIVLLATMAILALAAWSLFR